MGCKAVEVLLSLGQKEIWVISRSPKEAAARNQAIAEQVNFITFEDWEKSNLQSNLIISTIRNNQATFNASNPNQF